MRKPPGRSSGMIARLKTRAHGKFHSAASGIIFLAIQNVSVLNANRAHRRVPSNSNSGAFTQVPQVDALVHAVHITRIIEYNPADTGLFNQRKHIFEVELNIFVSADFVAFIVPDAYILKIETAQ